MESTERKKKASAAKSDAKPIAKPGPKAKPDIKPDIKPGIKPDIKPEDTDGDIVPEETPCPALPFAKTHELARIGRFSVGRVLRVAPPGEGKARPGLVLTDRVEVREDSEDGKSLWAVASEGSDGVLEDVGTRCLDSLKNPGDLEDLQAALEFAGALIGRRQREDRGHPYD